MRMTIGIAGLTALVLTLLPAMHHGHRNFRWGADTQMERWSEVLNRFPNELGDWKAVSDQKLSNVEYEMLRPQAYVNRIFSDGTRSAHLFILMGPTGPTAVHTPDICFNSRDYAAQGERQAISLADIPGSESHCWQIDFQHKGVSGHFLRSWYAWTNDGRWHAAKNPRFQFASQPALVKIQVVLRYPSAEEMENDEIGETFVKLVERWLTSELFEPSM